MVKIKGISCKQTLVPLKKPFKTALRTATSIEVIVVRIQLENGQEGLGSAASTWKITGESLSSIEAAIKGPIADVVKNRDIEDLEGLLTDIQNSCVGNTSAKAAVDIALHDLYCRVFGLPLYSLLGGRTAPLETDITIGLDDADIMGIDAHERTQQGFNMLKVKVGNDERTDIRRIQRIREAVGDEVLLRLDANQGWNSKQAVKIIRFLEKENMGIELIEQPVQMADIDGLKFIRERVETPIMADESVFSPRDAFRLLKEEAVDLLNIKLMKCGGIRRARQVADIAESAGIECMIGSMMESSISVTAAAHLAYSHKNITRYDLDAPLWLKDEPLKGGMQFEGKDVKLLNTAGLGIEG